MENQRFVDQLAQAAPSDGDHPAMRCLAERPDLFRRRGSIVAAYRRRNGRTFGPYYRLTYREDGRQRSIYLGAPGGLLDQVREKLHLLQEPLKQFRLFNSLEREGRASLRVEKAKLAMLLRQHGLSMKGFEVRGWRQSSLPQLFCNAEQSSALQPPTAESASSYPASSSDDRQQPNQNATQQRALQNPLQNGVLSPPTKSHLSQPQDRTAPQKRVRADATTKLGHEPLRSKQQSKTGLRPTQKLKSKHRIGKIDNLLTNSRGPPSLIPDSNSKVRSHFQETCGDAQV